MTLIIKDVAEKRHESWQWRPTDGWQPESAVKVEWIRVLLQFIEVGIRGWSLKQAAIKEVSLCKALVTLVKDESTSSCSAEQWNNRTNWALRIEEQDQKITSPANTEASLKTLPEYFGIFCIHFVLYCTCPTGQLFLFILTKDPFLVLNKSNTHCWRFCSTHWLYIQWTF